MGVPTFQVASVTIKRTGKVIRAERDDRGRWRLTAPVSAPANPAKVESLLAALVVLAGRRRRKRLRRRQRQGFHSLRSGQSGRDGRADVDASAEERLVLTRRQAGSRPS